MHLPSKGHPFIYIVVIFGALTLWTQGCYKEVFTSNTGDHLRFSLDTLRFDTVFTTVGSATRSFKVFNDASLPIKIESIKIKSGSISVFRINVDGVAAPAKELSNVEIRAKDSIYVFLEVTIQPNQSISVSPFVIADQVDFTTNGNHQTVHLEAWGQNANYIPSRYGNGQLALLSCNLQDETWSDPKPYVIYGVLFIDSCNLHIPAGARIYVHGGLVRTKEDIYNDGIIYVLPHGRISVEGTVDRPVTFTTDRLEKELKDEWGAWAGIRIGQGSSGSKISNAVIRNAFVGVYADSASDVTLRNTKIYNTASSGLIGVHARVVAENCLFYNNGSHGMQFAYGGAYRVDYCTVASYEGDGEGISLNNALVRDPEKGLVSVFPLVANVTNSIFYGSGRDEINLTDLNPKEPLYFQTSFANCYIKAEELLTAKNYPKFFETCTGCIQAKNKDTVFLNVSKQDFRLDTMSIVGNKAKPLDRLPFDIIGVRRDASAPDMGCYELKK